MSNLIPASDVPGIDYTEGGVFTEGNRFTVSAGTWAVRSISWYLKSAAYHAPDLLILWDVTANLALTSITPAAGTAVGWHTEVLISEQSLDPTHTYLVGARMLTGYHSQQFAGAQAPESPLTFGGAYYSTATGSTTPLPATANPPGEYGYSAEVTGSGGTGSATVGDVQNALIDWLSATGDNLHQVDGLPWLTHAAVTALQADEAMRQGSVSELGMFPAGSRDLAGAAATIYALLSQTGGVVDLIQKLRGTTTSTNLTDVWADLDTRLTTIEGETSTLPNKYLPFDGATWVLSAELDWDTALAWNVPADAYIVTVTTAPGFRPTTDVAGFTWQPRLAWWAPWNGLQAGERHFIDFPASVVQDGSNRQPGILLYSEGGGAGHIQAWLRP